MAKIGIMSFAHMHAVGYAACVKQVPDAELVAVWDESPKRGREMAKQFDARYERDMDKFLALDTDAVIITSENVKHRPHVEAAAKAGKWILCEKPLATTVADAKAMISACKKAGVGLGTAFPCRYNRPLMELHDAIASGEYGKVLAANCTNNGSCPGGWFVKEELSGGGATMDHTVHVADLLRWITGKEFTKVYCQMDQSFTKGHKADDIGALQMEMEDGIIVTHIASWNRTKSFPTWGDVTIEIMAEGGALFVDAFNQKIDVYSDVTGKGSYIPWGDNMDLGLIRDFVNAVDEKREPTISGVDGLKATEVTVAAYKSAKQKKMVAV